jgi:hypothetical protein
MKQNILLILFIKLYLIKIIFSKCNTGLTFNSNQAKDCLINSTSDYFCCAITRLNYSIYSDFSTSTCFQIDKNSNFVSPSIVLNNIDNYIDCGPDFDSYYISINHYNKCGPYYPIDSNDCEIYSKTNNSCCFYNSYGNQGCAWAGMKYYGSSILNSGNLTVSCPGQIIKSLVYTYTYFFLLSILIIN